MNLKRAPKHARSIGDRQRSPASAWRELALWRVALSPARAVGPSEGWRLGRVVYRASYGVEAVRAVESQRFIKNRNTQTKCEIELEDISLQK